jgi:hypothetical protein
MTSKYKNEPVMFNGIPFDSRDELRYYQFLLDLKQRGVISEIVLQPCVELMPKFEKHGRKYKAITYTPDFLVTYSNGGQVYIDLKGMSTQQGIMRRKMFAYMIDTPLHWVAASKKYSETGFLDYDELQRLRREAKRGKKA